jgi:thiamine biosynthesis protein ThiI
VWLSPSRPGFKSRRGEKRFPLKSSELDQYLAERLPEDLWDKLEVRLKGAELEIGVEVRAKRAYIYFERLAGAGGLPVGTLGRVACLLSGGIDSPVAAYYAMRRGCRVHFVSFLSPPYIGDATRAKILELVRQVGRFQPRSDVFFVPFTAIQEAIRDHAPAPYRTVLYRRMMQRLASRIAYRHKARALVTGESIGQVASQTLENITCIEDAADMPVIRPLIGFDKTETIDVAKRIGTLDISNLPEPDCCTVFMPPAPVIHGRVAECHAAEAELDMERLVRDALEGTEHMRLEGGELVELARR